MITSVHNPKVQAVRKLQSQARERHQQRAFVVEGVRLCEEALKAGWDARQVFITDLPDERAKAVVEGFIGRNVPVEPVSQAVMETLSETETPQGLVVVIRQQALPLPSPLDLLLILDGLRDPGNLGTILRTALAAGVQGVLLAPGCVDAWSGKVLRSGMGAHFYLPIHSLPWPDIWGIVKAPSAAMTAYLADVAGGRLYSQVNFQVPLALIIGGEAAGAGADARALSDEMVHIPIQADSESLNAAIAAGVLLFEVVRQRSG